MCVSLSRMFESLEAFLIKQYPLPQTMMDAVMLTGANKNCEEDVDKFPLTLSRAAQATDMEILVPQVTEYQQMLIDLPIAVSSILPLAEQLDSTSISIGEINVLAFFAGFINRKFVGAKNMLQMQYENSSTLIPRY